jgi:hypothetical protein
MTSPLFGLLILDRDPAMFSDLPGLAQAWFQDAGGFIFPGLIAYIIYALFSNTGDSGRTRTNLPTVTLLGAAAAMLLYAVYYYLAFVQTGEDTLNKKVRGAQLDQYNFILVVGAAEAADGSVNVRTRDNVVVGASKLADCIAMLKGLVAEYK